MLADLQESLSGVRIITAHNRRAHNVVVHDSVIGEHLDANLWTARIGAVYGPGTEAVGIIGQALTAPQIAALAAPPAAPVAGALFF